jgi:molecular chaperone DnaJ
VHVLTPSRLDAKERALIEEFARKSKAPEPQLAQFHQGLFARLRDRFRNG